MKMKGLLRTVMVGAAVAAACLIGLVVAKKYWLPAHEVPITGRRQIALASFQAEVEAANQAWAKIKEEHANDILPENHPFVKKVKQIAFRMIPLTSMADRPWEIVVIKSDQINALSLSGKIAVFTGICKIAPDDDSLAAIIAHELAHSLARHTGEMPTSWTNNQQVREKEADIMGLLLMSKACFDPYKAIEVWKRSAQFHIGTFDHELKSREDSTHPPPEERIKYLTEWLPKALAVRDELNCPALPYRPLDTFPAETDYNVEYETEFDNMDINEGKK